MESAFIEFLDQLYDVGYAIEFKETNPGSYYRQLAEFENQYSHKKHETPPVYNGASRSANRATTIRSRAGIRRLNANQH